MTSTSVNTSGTALPPDDVAGHLSTTFPERNLSAWAPIPGDETCAYCGRQLVWAGVEAEHRYASGDRDRCTYDRPADAISA